MRRSSTPFTPFEDAILCAHYPLGGASACALILPGRLPDAIARRASRLGVRYEGAAGARTGKFRHAVKPQKEP